MLLEMVGDGVFGPFDEDPVVYEECEPPFKIEDPSDPSELTRGEDVPEECACCGCGRGKEGSLSFAYSDR